MKGNPPGVKLPEYIHIQNILRKTKAYGMVFCIIELIGIFAMGFLYMSTHHPYFIQKILPGLLIYFLTRISAIIALPAVLIGPIIFALLIIACIIALACLIISIRQFKKWKALNLPDQNYNLALRSIIYNSCAIIPTIFLSVVLLYSIITRYSL